MNRRARFGPGPASTEWKADGTRVFTMYDDDGKTVGMRITYKRRK